MLTAPIAKVGDYLRVLDERSGAPGRAAGVAILNSMDSRPPAFQKILVQSHLSKAELENYSQLIADYLSAGDTVVRRPVPDVLPEWIVLWSNFGATSAGEERLAALVATRQPVARFSRDSLAVSVFRIRER